MDIRFDGQQTFVRPLINEQQVSVSRVFTALRERQRLEQPVAGKELQAFEQFKQQAKSNASPVRETQSALQASHEIQENAQYVLRLITELQELAKQSSNPALAREDRGRLQGRSLQIKQELQATQQASRQELKPLLEKYNPDVLASAGLPLGETRRLQATLGQFALGAEELQALSLDDLETLDDWADRTEGLLGYMTALDGRLNATLSFLEPLVETPIRRIATPQKAKEVAQEVSRQIVEKAGAALSSQSNMAYTDVMTLLEI